MTNFYVKTSGNDNNKGSWDKPWKTIQKAANVMNAGDVCNILPGNYSSFVPQNSGTKEFPIIYRGYSGEKPIIDGNGLTPTDWDYGTIDIRNLSRIVIDGLEVKNAGWWFNIKVTDSDHIEIKNCYSHDAYQSGIGVWESSDIVIDNNELENVASQGNEAITFRGTSNFEIKNNHVHDIAREGIDCKQGTSNGLVYGNKCHDIDKAGIYIDASADGVSNIEIYENKIYDCGIQGIAIACEQGGLLRDIDVHDNRIFGCGRIGLMIARWHNPSPMIQINIYDNVIYENGYIDVNPGAGGILNANVDAENIMIHGNIVSQNNLFQIANRLEASSIVDRNLIHGFRDAPGETKGTNYIEPINDIEKFIVSLDVWKTLRG